MCIWDSSFEKNVHNKLQRLEDSQRKKVENLSAKEMKFVQRLDM